MTIIFGMLTLVSSGFGIDSILDGEDWVDKWFGVLAIDLSILIVFIIIYLWCSDIGELI